MNSINCTERFISSIPPTCFAELLFCFEYDFAVEELDTVIGLSPADSQRQSKTRINPITGDHNPGYWLYRTKTFSSYDIDMLCKMLNTLLETHSVGLRNAIDQYKASDFFVRLRVQINQEGEYPSLRFSPALLSLISTLDAYLDIEVDNEYTL